MSAAFTGSQDLIAANRLALSAPARDVLLVDRATDDTPDRDLHAQASSVLMVHTDSEGLCAGCMEFAARLSWWPCLQVEWARAALAALTEFEPAHEADRGRGRR